MSLWNLLSERFSEVWAVDFEFTAPLGENPVVICMVARELKSGNELRLWSDELSAMTHAPFNTGKDAVLVAYYASAEMNCFISLGWKRPEFILDLYPEFKLKSNGLEGQSHSLLSALAAHGLDSIGHHEKEEMRNLAMRGAPFTDEEKESLLEYCASDVGALDKLARRFIQQGSTLDHALLRGEYTWAVAQMESNGIPIDTATLESLKTNWPSIKDAIIAEVDAAYGVYESGVFKQTLFERYLIAQNIPWPRTPSGKLSVDDDTFREMAKAYPQLHPLRELKVTLSSLKLNDLAVGKDGRNRTLLSPFKSKTGRNQPSNTKFVFGPARWIRGMIKPAEGKALAYIDWSQQEFGIAAALSQDDQMKAAYLSGDPYLMFAKQAGAVPLSATKRTHPREREQYKACVLAVQYGMGADSLAMRINSTVREARHLLSMHRDTYNKFWSWSDSLLDSTMLSGYCRTVFGWSVQVPTFANARSLANFPMQANGSEMLRLACMMMAAKGIKVCAPIHDAILIEGDANEIEFLVETAQTLMEEASATVLDGFRLRSDAKIVKYPERYMDEGGVDMWQSIISILERHEHLRTQPEPRRTPVQSI